VLLKKVGNPFFDVGISNIGGLASLKNTRIKKNPNVYKIKIAGAN
jgi:hypothetical protein